ncbi:hypothetical protein [Flavivirga spongiicola]|uniref:Uncharacterized protein n=1 Tax=Flavivirga spongiicola TaxID=421621 RepID=A0ABU7XT31_9FLAO|nr:hypothetical protein [Flavivirga sp. MEBiC05379]MDO5978940.1 hypothetical protein [Flavivirga sp. MEBiC05379]
MNSLRRLLIILFFVQIIQSFGQNQGTFGSDDIDALIPIIKDDHEYWCREIDRHKIGFFPTSELIQEFKELGMPSKAIRCLRKKVQENLKIHVIKFECFSPKCHDGIKADISYETKEAIFFQKSNKRKFRNFSRKVIADYIKDTAKFNNQELPTVFLTGIIHKSDSSLTAKISLKYQNQNNVGGQLLATKNIEFKSLKGRDVQKACNQIALWALSIIEDEINH